MNYFFTASERPLPAFKRTTLLLGILIGFPVAGFLPVLALRSAVENVPKPTKITLSAFFKLFFDSSKYGV